MKIKPDFLIVLMVVILPLSGCIYDGSGEDSKNPKYFDHLTLGTTVDVTNHSSTTGIGLPSVIDDRRWVLESVEQRLGQFGLLEEMAIFKLDGRQIEALFEINTKHLDLTKIISERSGSRSIFGPPAHAHCATPDPLSIIVLLAGAQSPSTIEEQMIRGGKYKLEIHRNSIETKLEYKNDWYSTKANITHLDGGLEGDHLVEVQSLASERCRNSRIDTSQITVKFGEGAPVPFQFGWNPSPYPVEDPGWPPRFDLSTADFSLKRAVDRLDMDPRFQDFKSGQEIWPVWLRYRTTFSCWDPFDTTPSLEWEILLVREDGQAFHACVTIPKGLEVLPAETVIFAREVNTQVSLWGVESVNFETLQEITKRFSGDSKDRLVYFEFLVRPPNEFRWWASPETEIVLGEAENDEVAQCWIDGGSGAISECREGIGRILL